MKFAGVIIHSMDVSKESAAFINGISSLKMEATGAL
jgi:hypothetical protein